MVFGVARVATVAAAGVLGLDMATEAIIDEVLTGLELDAVLDGVLALDVVASDVVELAADDVSFGFGSVRFVIILESSFFSAAAAAPLLAEDDLVAVRLKVFFESLPF